MAAVARLCFLLLATAAVSRGTLPADLREIRPFLNATTVALVPKVTARQLRNSLVYQYQDVQTVPDSLGPGLKFSVMFWKYLKETPDAAPDQDQSGQTPEQGEGLLKGKPEVGLSLSWECNVQEPPPACNAGGSLYHELEVELIDRGASSSGGPGRPPKYLMVYCMAIFFTPAKEGAFSKRHFVFDKGSEVYTLKTISQAMPKIGKKCKDQPNPGELLACVRFELAGLYFGTPRGIAVGRRDIVDTYAPGGHVIRLPIDLVRINNLGQMSHVVSTPESRVIMLLPGASDVGDS